MPRTPLLTAALLALGLVAACAGSRWARAPKVVFPISAEAADRVMHDAMAEQFGAQSIHRVSYPLPGYRCDETVVKRVGTRGRTRAGETVDGFSFQGKGNGSQAVLALIARLAAEVAEPLPVRD